MSIIKRNPVVGVMISIVMITIAYFYTSLCFILCFVFLCLCVNVCLCFVYFFCILCLFVCVLCFATQPSNCLAGHNMAHANLNDLMAMPEMRTVKRTMDNMKDCIFI